ncbi:MAG: 2-amino-4-hydroxy-6-hydroxymethyldihydropteridine diphosphokinase [Acidobacteriota bacterium]
MNGCSIRRGLYLGLGSNLGNRHAHLRKAHNLLNMNGLNVIRRSRIYLTEAVDCSDPRPFLNQVVEVTTWLTPRDVLARTRRIEQESGRRPSRPNAPRTLDIDLLLDGATVCDTAAGPRLPHPRLHRRRFVLVPLAEIAPHAVHPVLCRTAKELLEGCRDRAGVSPWRPGEDPGLPRDPGPMYDGHRSRTVVFQPTSRRSSH